MCIQIKGDYFMLVALEGHKAGESPNHHLNHQLMTEKQL
jgi:hypothetical protein